MFQWQMIFCIHLAHHELDSVNIIISIIIVIIILILIIIIILHALQCNSDMQYMLLHAELHICCIQQIWHIVQLAGGQSLCQAVCA